MDKEIVKSCVRCGNKLFTGFDHGECFERISINDAENAEQGFIDNEGNFVDRKGAMIVAEKAGQLKYKLGKKTLISEDLRLNWLNKQADKIADLEAKLADTKKAFNTISAKYEKKSEQIFEIIKRQEECSDAYNLLSKENEQLKQQLEKKEKENSVLKAVIDKNKTGQFGAVHICNAISEFYEPLVKDMIIAELEKVKEYWLKHEDIGYYVDQQIKLLKGEKWYV